MGLGPKYWKPGSPQRVESIPAIENPNLHYLVVDVVADSGQTVLCATSMLVQQGVPSSHIRFFGYTVHTGFNHVLDKVDTIIEYLNALKE